LGLPHGDVGLERLPGRFTTRTVLVGLCRGNGDQHGEHAQHHRHDHGVESPRSRVPSGADQVVVVIERPVGDLVEQVHSLATVGGARLAAHVVTRGSTRSVLVRSVRTWKAYSTPPHQYRPTPQIANAQPKTFARSA